jgi:hypothetical protein
MAISVTLVGSDIKIDDGTGVIEYVPVTQLKQRSVGTKVELYRNDKLIRGDEATEYTIPSGTSAAICDGIALLNSAAAGTIQGLPYMAAVARGLVPGESDASFAAVNEEIQTSDTTIWDSDTDQNYTFLEVDTQMYVNSTNSGDTTQTIVVNGINDAGVLTTVSATLNGQTQVALSGLLQNVFNVVVISTTTPDGDIYVTSDLGVTAGGVPNVTDSTKARIMQGNNATENGIRIVPAGKIMEFLAVKFGSGKADDMTFKINVKPVGNVAFRTVEIKSYEAFIYSPIPLLVQLTAGVRVEFIAKCATTNKACNVIVDAILRDV